MLEIQFAVVVAAVVVVVVSFYVETLVEFLEDMFARYAVVDYA